MQTYKQNNRMRLKSQPDVGVEQSIQDKKFWFGVQFPPRRFLDHTFLIQA
jgi:hypothetical protein